MSPCHTSNASHSLLLDLQLFGIGIEKYGHPLLTYNILEQLTELISSQN